MSEKLITKDPWTDLKKYTSARIALGRTGGSLRTNDWLDFKLAHARARDAVHCEFDSELLRQQLAAEDTSVLVLNSRVRGKTEFLKRPDLGRRLDKTSIKTLKKNHRPADLVVIISDGLSAMAIHAHVGPLLAVLTPLLLQDGWSLTPTVIVRFGRVAIEDEIGELIGAKIALILIGERPGLGSPDSLGAYLVHKPAVGNTDANRNCVSNIRVGGLSYQKAANTLFYLLKEAKLRQLSGVLLKDERVLKEKLSVR